jgi:thymidylate synthase (FAD)
MILKHFTIEDFKDTFPLSSFGARVCYSDGNIRDLLSDLRITNRLKRAEFLRNLAYKKHFSVFSHSFIYKQVGKEDALHIGATHFKSRYNPEYPDIIGISLRHYLEELWNNDPDKFDAVFEEMAKYDTTLNVLEKYLLGNIRVSNFGLIHQDLGVYLLYLNTDYDGYAVFYVDGISRIATHQLVRHTALNFSQRSQRYVKEDDNYTVMPKSILGNGEAKAKFSLHEDLLKFLYKDLVYNHKIKREDVRYLLPAGAKTSIVISGTLNWINDFIEKRLDPHAQWEIREVARMMQDTLDKRV